jgi:hypothetical protein
LAIDGNKFESKHVEEISKKERKKTIQIFVLCVNCFFGYLPNKLANNIFLYFLDTNTYNLYIAYSNMLIWLSHSIKIFINLSFDPEYFKVFCGILHTKVKERGDCNIIDRRKN